MHKNQNKKNTSLHALRQIMTASIVIPVYNEEDNIRELISNLYKVLPGLCLTQWEIIIVDDSSSDATLEILKELQPGYQGLKLISLRRNFGQTAALSAGIDTARFEVIITLDGDLQNDPADIPLFLEKINQGYDVVSGWRKQRKDHFFTRRLPSHMANLLISKVTGVRLKDYGCTLKAYRSQAIKDIHLFGDMHRFIPALISRQGVKIAEVEVRHHARKHGKTKYGMGRIVRVVLDLLTVKFMIGFISRPMQMFGPFGLLLMSSGFFYGLFLTGQRIFFHLDIKPLRPLISVLMIITGIQLISMGLLGEMIMRTYFESQRKKIYQIREVIE